MLQDLRHIRQTPAGRQPVWLRCTASTVLTAQKVPTESGLKLHPRETKMAANAPLVLGFEIPATKFCYNTK